MFYIRVNSRNEDSYSMYQCKSYDVCVITQGGTNQPFSKDVVLYLDPVDREILPDADEVRVIDVAYVMNESGKTIDTIHAQ